MSSISNTEDTDERRTTGKISGLSSVVLLPSVPSVLRVFALAALLALTSASRAAESDAPVRQAVERSIPFLEKEGVKWMTKRKCVSCHQIPAMLWSLNHARNHGFEVSQEKLDEWTQWSADKMAAIDKDPKRQPPVDNLIQMMLGRQTFSADVSPPAQFQEFPAWIAKQQTNGFWKAGGQLPRQKRPARETDEATTMWTLLALKSDGSKAPNPKQTRQWLKEAKPGTSAEWWAVRALLAKQSGKKRQTNKAIQKLLNTQNEDGGWGWILGAKSDALGTGFALHAIGRASDPSAHTEAIQKARAFLTKTQRDDGSWEVPSTKKANDENPEPTSIYWGTAWAVVGLLDTSPEAKAAQ